MARPRFAVTDGQAPVTGDKPICACHPLRRGRWKWTGEDATVHDDCYDPEMGIYYNDALKLGSRQDCDDLIALLQRVRERLPDGR